MATTIITDGIGPGGSIPVLLLSGLNPNPAVVIPDGGTPSSIIVDGLVAPPLGGISIFMLQGLNPGAAVVTPPTPVVTIDVGAGGGGRPVRPYQPTVHVASRTILRFAVALQVSGDLVSISLPVIAVPPLPPEIVASSMKLMLGVRLNVGSEIVASGMEAVFGVELDVSGSIEYLEDEEMAEILLLEWGSSVDLIG